MLIYCLFLLCTVAVEGTTEAMIPLPVFAVITSLEHCERYLSLMQHEDLDSPVFICLFIFLLIYSENHTMVYEKKKIKYVNDAST